MKPIILIVDDDAAHRDMLKMLLRGWGYQTDEASDGDEAVEYIKKQPVDLVLTDVRMARMDGISALAEIHRWNPAIPVIVMTAWSSIENAVEAMRLGAYNYVTKPLDFDALKKAINAALAHTQPPEPVKKQTQQTEGLVGGSDAMNDLHAMIRTVAASDAAVLITGESGTGKNLVARCIHAAGFRASMPFVTLNCAAISEKQLGSELFGIENKAFAKAGSDRDGEHAQFAGGTIFLDDIGELPLPLQTKLLRIMELDESHGAANGRPKRSSARILSATKRDLAKDVADGRFREDLFYRLNVITIDIPPLRKRREDIPLLAGHFLGKYAAANRKTITGFTPQAMDLLLRYEWPGNVRELENAVERAVILSTTDYVTERSLPLTVQNYANSPNPAMPAGLGSKTLEEVEREAIAATMQDTESNKSEAARRLGITRATLHSKLKKYKLEKLWR